MMKKHKSHSLQLNKCGIYLVCTTQNINSNLISYISLQQ